MWIEDDVVNRALASGDDAELRAVGMPFCLSADRKYCLLVREHDAWQVDGGGWRDANRPPDQGERGRWALNFYKARSDGDPGYWFKTLIPLREGAVQLSSDRGSRCTIQGDATLCHVAFESIDGLMWDLMTGHAQSEDDIERAYGKIGAGAG